METMHARRESWARHVQAWQDSGLTQLLIASSMRSNPRHWPTGSDAASGRPRRLPWCPWQRQRQGCGCCRHASGWRCRRTSMQAGWPDCCGGWPDANAGPGLAGGRPINMRLGIDGLWCTFSRPSGDHPAMARPMPFAIGTARGSSCCSRTAPVCGWVSAVCIKAVFASSMPPNAAPRWSRSAKTSASSST